MKLTREWISTAALLCLVHCSAADNCDKSKLHEYRDVGELAVNLPGNLAEVEAKLKE